MTASGPDRALIGKRVRDFRIQKGLTQAELAARSGISIVTLYQVERGGPTRASSIDKICRQGLQTPLHSLLAVQVKMRDEAFLVYRADEAEWRATSDRRRRVPEDNLLRIQDPAERRRQGRLGFVAAFVNNPNLVMPDGPGTLFFEIHDRFEGPINQGVFRDCKLHLQAGRLRCRISEETLELGPGDILACRDESIRWIEPLVSLTPDEPVPLLLWMGAVRMGKAVREDGRRTIVRRPRPVP